MNLSQYEQETIINFNETEQTASVYTHNKALRHKLDKLAEERPEDCHFARESRGGQAGDYIVPKSWIRIKPPRVLSKAQLEASRKAAEKARLSRQTLPDGKD